MIYLTIKIKLILKYLLISWFRLLVWKDRCLVLEHPENKLNHYQNCEANHFHQQRIQKQFINRTQQRFEFYILCLLSELY